MATVKGDVHDIGKNIVGVVLQCNNYQVIDLGVMVPAAKILDTARQVKADAIGLSGLITPSLDEMVHVAQEMQREGFDLPLLIGGATTSRAHTAVKIAPKYQSSTVHVLDASRAVGVVSSLLNEQQRKAFDSKIRAEYATLREQYAAKSGKKKLLTIHQARANRVAIDWTNYTPPRPEFTRVRLYSSDGSPDVKTARGQGIEVSAGSDSCGAGALLPCAAEKVTIDTLVEYIDWSPFFHTWELRGRFPAILDDPIVGKQARELFDDAQQVLRQIVDENHFTARGVHGLWPAIRQGDDVDIFAGDDRPEKLATLYFLRQQMVKPDGQPNYCLADFIAPAAEGVSTAQDYIGGFAVSIHGADELAKRFAAEHDDYSAILAKALADRLAEAFAEYLHKQTRLLWGFGKQENLSPGDLIAERYRGIRPAAGYPACPDHAEKQTLFGLLDAERVTGIRLTESFAMYPASSVSGLYFSHPEAKYFGVGKIGADQVADYAQRRGESLAEVEKRLGPNLGYEAA
jgi:5-methyltetrahydrofolate--homocysteine methyltransferase